MSKPIFQHLQENGQIAKRQSARGYSHVLLVAYVSVSAEISRLQRDADRSFRSFASWSDAEKANAEAHLLELVAYTEAHGSEFEVVSWHSSEANAQKAAKAYGARSLNVWMKVEAINNGVRE